MTHQHRVGRSKARYYWTWYWRVASTSTACVRAGGNPAENYCVDAKVAWSRTC